MNAMGQMGHLWKTSQWDVWMWDLMEFTPPNTTEQLGHLRTIKRDHLAKKHSKPGLLRRVFKQLSDSVQQCQEGEIFLLFTKFKTDSPQLEMNGHLDSATESSVRIHGCFFAHRMVGSDTRHF